MSTKHTHTQPRSLARLSRTAVHNMQSLGAYGITFTSFTTEIHPSFYILIPILVLALLMALLAPFCLLRAFVRATRHGCLPILDGWVWGREGTMSSLAQHADGFVRPTGHAIQLSNTIIIDQTGKSVKLLDLLLLRSRSTKEYTSDA